MQVRPELPAPEHPKNTDFIDTAASDDPDQRCSQHLVPAVVTESTPPITNPRSEVANGGRSYLTVSPELPSTHIPSCPTALSDLPMSEIPEKMTSGAPRSSRSGSQTSGLTSVPRSVRYNPIGGVPSMIHSVRGRKGRPSKREDSTDNDSDSSTAHDHAVPRALRLQEIRRPQIGSERRRRDEHGASHHRLKHAVPTHGRRPASHQRPSKLTLLDHATARIDCLEKSRKQLLAKIREVEEEAARLRQANEALAQSAVSQRPACAPPPP